jgi:hypothetical protein
MYDMSVGLTFYNSHFFCRVLKMNNISSTIGAWSFHPLITSLPSIVLPNVAYWNVTNGTWEYQVQVSWPLNWTSIDAESTVQTLCAHQYTTQLLTTNLHSYVLDGNAQALPATEAFRRIRPNDPVHPDTIIVSIGYPELAPGLSLRRRTLLRLPDPRVRDVSGP